MAKLGNDRTTIDLFDTEKRAGRPRTSPFSRKEQLKINKRNQSRRDRENGVKRIELKVESGLFNSLNEHAEFLDISRSELIERVLIKHLNYLDTENHN